MTMRETQQNTAKHSADKQIAAQLSHARKALSARRYDQATAACERAADLVAESDLFRYCAQIDQLRLQIADCVEAAERATQLLDGIDAPAEAGAAASDLAALDQFLAELIRSDLADQGIGVAARRDELWAVQPLADGIAEVRELFRNQDFEAARRLVEIVYQAEPGNVDAILWHNRVIRQWDYLQGMLEDARQKLAASRVEDGLAVLAGIRTSWPQNPNWAGMWRRTHLGLGRERSEAGREAIQQDAFEEASAAFGFAIEAFRGGLEVAGESSSLQAGRDESLALAQFAVQMSRALDEQRAHHWDKARQALADAAAALEDARHATHGKLSDVDAVLQSHSRQVDVAIAAVARARELLAQGRKHLEQAEYATALASFKEGCACAEPYDEQLAFELSKALEEAQTEDAGLTGLLQQAADAPDQAARLEVLASGRTRWPNARPFKVLLVETLLDAAGVAAQSGNDAQAIDWARQAAELSDDVAGVAARDRAAAFIAQVEAKRNTEAWLREADALQAQLEQGPLPKASDYQPLIELLESARQETEGYGAYRPQVAARLKQSQDRMMLLASVEAIAKEAEALCEQGLWGEAAIRLGAALEALGDLPADELHARRARWHSVSAAVSVAMEAAAASVATARDLYGGILNDLADRPLAVLEPLWTQIDEALGAATTTLASPPDEAVFLPDAWQQLAREATQLTARVRVLESAAGAASSNDLLGALELLRQAATDAPSDRVIAGLYARVLGDARGAALKQAEGLLRSASEHIDSGEWAAAEEALLAANELALAREATALTRRSTERRIELWKEIDRLHAEWQGGNQEVLLRLLTLSADPDSGLTSKVREALNGLLGLEHAPLQDESLFARGRQCYEDLARAALPQRLVQRNVLAPARAWLNQLAMQSYENFIASQLALGDYVRAYRSARTALDLWPASERLSELADQIAHRVRDLLCQASAAQIARATALQDQGSYAEGLAALDTLDPAVLQLRSEMEREFPEAIREDRRLAELRDTGDELRRVLSELRAATVELTALVARGRELYTSGRLAEARHTLDRARLVDGAEQAAPAWRAWKALSDEVDSARRADALATVRAALLNAENQLGVCHTVPQAESIIAGLVDVRPISWQFQGPEEDALCERLDRTLQSAQHRLAQLQEAALARESAAKAAEQQELELQLSALQRAERSALGQDLEDIRAESERIRPQAARQAQMRAAWDRALIGLNRDDFAAAHADLAVAQHLGQPEDILRDYRIAVEAGLQLREAAELAKTDSIAAQAQLRAIMHATQACSPAGRVYQQSQALLNDLESSEQRRLAAEAATREALELQRKLEESQRLHIARLLREAQTSLRMNRLADARGNLEEVLSTVPDHPEGRQLWDRLDRAGQAEALLARARALQEEAEYDPALQLVDTILELYPESIGAREFSAQLGTERVVGTAVARALRLAGDQRFAEARAELQAATEKNPAHPRLMSAADQLQSLEEHYWNGMVAAAADGLARSDYRSALSTYRDLRAHTELADAQAQVVALEQAAVDQWAGWVTRQATETLGNREARSADLLRVERDVAEVLAATPKPAETTAQDLRKLARNVMELRLERRLAEGYDALRAGDVRQAQAIGAELEETTVLGGWPQLDFLVVTFSEDVLRVAQGQSAAPGQPALPDADSGEVQQLFDQFEAALGCWQLDEATRFLNDARRTSRAGERLETAAARLASASECLARQQQTFETAWRYLAQRDFANAKQAFGNVLELPGEPEAQVWADYAEFLGEGVELALALDDEAAVAYLREAESLLGLQSDLTTTLWWKSRLLDERLRAAYYAHTLTAEIEGIISDKRIKDRLKAGGESSGAVAVLKRLIQRQENLPEIVQTRPQPTAEYRSRFLALDA